MVDGTPGVPKYLFKKKETQGMVRFSAFQSKYLTTPSCQSWERLPAIKDMVEPSVPTNPAAFDWITASRKMGYLWSSKEVREKREPRREEMPTMDPVPSSSARDRAEAIPEQRLRSTTPGPSRRSS